MTFSRFRILTPLLALLAGGAQTPPRSAHAGERPVEAVEAPQAARSWAARFESRLAALHREMDPGPLATAPAEVPHAKLNQLARSLPGAELGISVRDLMSGHEVFSWHADEALNPASNHKLLTASAALELLGSDFRFETHVRRHGDTLYLIGGGDPSLQVEDLEALIERIEPGALEGVTRLAFDDSMFSDERWGPGYASDGPGHSYMAPSGALSLQFNTLEVTVSPTREGTPARVQISPACGHVDIHSTVRTRTRGRRVGVRTQGAGDKTRVEVAGGLAPGSAPYRIRRRITHPGHFTASVFARLLAQRLDHAELPIVAEHAPAVTEAIALHRSAPLPEVLISALKFSNNFTIEQVLRTLGHLDSGEPGDWTNGADVLERFWVAIGEDPAELRFENASGLSAMGRLSPRALTHLMQLWVRADGRGHPMVHALPVAGREGTLHDRLHHTRGRVRAKTGTLSGATALTGVISNPAGEPTLGFSILVNGPISARKARRTQDRIVSALVKAQVG